MCIFSEQWAHKTNWWLHNGPISVVFPDIYVSKIEEDIVAPMKPHFYKRHVDDAYIRRKKNEPDSLFEKLNSYHRNILFTIEKKPYQILRYRNHSTWVWNRNKSNAITGELHRAKRIADNFNFEVKRKTKMSLWTSFPRYFIRSSIDHFSKDKNDNSGMVFSWVKANYSTTTVFRIKQKIYEKLYQKACYIYK